MAAAAVRDRRAERHALFESILDDPSASHSDRLRADEQLRELEREEQRTGASSARLSPEQAAEEFATLKRAVAAMDAIECGPSDIEAPTEEADLREIIELQEAVIDALEARLAERERALTYEHRHHLLPAAPQWVPA